MEINFFDIITEVTDTRQKAMPAEFKLVRSKLSKDTKRPIPDCAVDFNGEYNWENIAALVWVRGMRDKPEYKYEQALKDVGLHNVRQILPEIYFYFWDINSKKDVVAHWKRIFSVVDSFDTCENCRTKKVNTWRYCASCGYDFIQKTEPERIEPQQEAAKSVDPTH